MARLSPILLAFALGIASAAALVSCGGGDDANLLPGTTAEQIESNLDRVDELAGEDDCIGAEDAVAEVTEEVEGLEGVDLKLKTALQEGTARLSEVVSSCEEETTEETEPTLEPDVETEEVEKEEKPKQEKPEKETPESEQEPGEDEGPELPPQSNGKGEENGKGGGEEPTEPETEETPSSGGVGPSVGVE